VIAISYGEWRFGQWFFETEDSKFEHQFAFFDGVFNEPFTAELNTNFQTKFGARGIYLTKWLS